MDCLGAQLNHEAFEKLELGNYEVMRNNCDLWQTFGKKLKDPAMIVKFPGDKNRGRWIRSVINPFRFAWDRKN